MILTIIIIIINFNDCELSTLVTKNVSLFNDDNLDVLYLSKDSSNRKLFHNNNDSMIPTNLNENFQDFSITFEKNQLKKQRQQQQQQQQQSQFLYDDNIKEESSVPYTAALAPSKFDDHDELNFDVNFFFFISTTHRDKFFIKIEYNR